MVDKLALEIAAEVTGWTYFIVWTISFYPQTYLNWKRKSVVGFSFDFLALNIMGYLTYSIYTIVIYSDSKMQDYFRREDHSTSRDNPVKLTDVVFATHGFVIVLFQIGQVLVYERGTQRVKKCIVGICVMAFSGLCVLVIVAVFTHNNSIKMWALVLMYCGYVKSASSFTKCIPQIYLNFRRNSTEGWSISAIWMDFAGGALSVVQMLIYCVIDGDSTQLTGNVPKLLLSCESLIFDCIFMLQHYICYPSQPCDKTEKQINKPKYECLTDPSETID